MITRATVSRRRLLTGMTGLAGMAGLAGLAGASALGACTASPTATSSAAGPATEGPPAATPAGATPAPARHAYGGDPAQFGELSRPAGASRGTVVLIHGGFWRAQYALDLDRPMARDLVARGYTVWNLEYRRVGAGGGWPATLQDVAAGFDHLATLLDPGPVVVIGHSAGGQLATWLAGRRRLAAGRPGADPGSSPVAVVSQAGVLDLVGAADGGVGGSAVPDLLGGTPAQVPDRYDDASPLARVPLDVPVRCVHAHADTNVPFAQSVTYVDAARAAGADATLTTVPGDHFTLIDPTQPAWHAVVDMLPGLLQR